MKDNIYKKETFEGYCKILSSHFCIIISKEKFSLVVKKKFFFSNLNIWSSVIICLLFFHSRII